jgi:hypothetical protein
MIFDEVYVISLPSRKERLDLFFDNLPKPWILGDIKVFEAIDGYKCKIPLSWKSGKGAWGCYQSHLHILKKSYENPSINNLLIFEDDAIFIDQFNSKVTIALNSLPIDWQMFYLGGQHLKMPKPTIINDCIGIGTNINRTHAYAINGRSTIEQLIKWLENLTYWKKNHHIDHHYGRLHENENILPYCTLKWLVGQRESFSNISRKTTKTRWWD